MTETVEIFCAGDFFRLIEPKSKAKFCDLFRRHSKITAIFRHKKSIIHLATLYKTNIFSY